MFCGGLKTKLFNFCPMQSYSILRLLISIIILITYSIFKTISEE